MKKKIVEPICVYDEFFDPDVPIRLSELLEQISVMQTKFGKHAILSFDAGYNNVSAYISPTKKVKK